MPCDYLSCSLDVLRFELFIDCIVDPEVDVATPEMFVLRERHIGHGTLIRFSNHLNISFTLKYKLNH